MQLMLYAPQRSDIKTAKNVDKGNSKLFQFNYDVSKKSLQNPCYYVKALINLHPTSKNPFFTFINVILLLLNS